MTHRPLTDKQQGWLAEVAPAAVEAGKRAGVPPRFLLARAAVETGWGAHKVGKHNILGLKKAMAHRLSAWSWTQEFLTVLRLNKIARERGLRIVEVPEVPADRLGRSTMVRSTPDPEKCIFAAPLNPGTGKRHCFLREEFADFDSDAECLYDVALRLVSSPVYRKAYLEFQRDQDEQAWTAAVLVHYATHPQARSAHEWAASHPQLTEALDNAMRGTTQ